MAHKISSMHVTYTDEFGAPRSESFDPEEIEEGLVSIDEAIKELLSDNATTIIFTIDTEEI